MAQNYFYPPSSGGSSANASVGLNGAAIPLSSTLIAGKGPGGLETPVSVDSSGDINVNLVGGTVTVIQPTGSNLHATIDSSALPTGASTSALQTSGNTSLSSITTSSSQISTNTAALTLAIGTTTSGSVGSMILAATSSSAPVLGPNILNPLSLTTAGALRVDGSSSTQPVSGTVFVSSIGAGSATIGDVAVNNFPAIQPVNGTVAVVQPTASSLNATVTGTVTVVQPTGANLNAQISNFPATQVVSQPTASSLNATVVGSVSESTPTALTIHNAALTVSTTAIRLTVSGSAPVSTRVTLVATPDSLSTAKFYIGSSSVTSTGATRGIQILAGQVFIANHDAGDYWIISDTASQTVEIMEQY